MSNLFLLSTSKILDLGKFILKEINYREKFYSQFLSGGQDEIGNGVVEDSGLVVVELTDEIEVFAASHGAIDAAATSLVGGIERNIGEGGLSLFERGKKSNGLGRGGLGVGGEKGNAILVGGGGVGGGGGSGKVNIGSGV